MSDGWNQRKWAEYIWKQYQDQAEAVSKLPTETRFLKLSATENPISEWRIMSHTKADSQRLAHAVKVENMARYDVAAREQATQRQLLGLVDNRWAGKCSGCGAHVDAEDGYARKPVAPATSTGTGTETSSRWNVICYPCAIKLAKPVTYERVILPTKKDEA